MDDTFLYIGNLPFDASERMVKDGLSARVAVENVWLARTPDVAKHFRGFGFAKLKSKEDVDSAVKDLNGLEFGDVAQRACYLDFGINQKDLWEEMSEDALP